MLRGTGDVNSPHRVDGVDKVAAKGDELPIWAGANYSLFCVPHVCCGPVVDAAMRSEQQPRSVEAARFGPQALEQGARQRTRRVDLVERFSNKIKQFRRRYPV
jgi:hypothetical protein